MNSFLTGEVVWAAESATSTAKALATAWPYLAISVLVTLGLVSTAFKILRNQTD